MSTSAHGRANRAARRHPDKVGTLARRYITVLEAAEYLRVSERTIRTMVTDGRLVAYRNGTRFVRLDLNEIDAAMVPFGGSVNP